MTRTTLSAISTRTTRTNDSHEKFLGGGLRGLVEGVAHGSRAEPLLGAPAP